MFLLFLRVYRVSRFTLLNAALSALIFCSALIFAFPRPAHAEKWALLIGIDAYKDRGHINNLGAASADARALKAALVEAAGFPEQNVTLLVSDADPTRGEATPAYNVILSELAELTRKVKPGDTVFVLYSGHGIETGGKTYLLPYDTDAFSDDTLTDTAIETGKFRDRLQAVHAGTLILAFDMCRTNPRKSGKGINEPNALTVKQVRGMDFVRAGEKGESTALAPAAPPVVVTLFACSPDERSYEWAEKGRGYFSYYLEEGLRGNAADRSGIVYLAKLTDYVAVNVQRSVRRVEGQDQTPFFEIKSAAGANEDLILSTNAFPVAAPAVTAAGDASVIDTRAQFRFFVSPSRASVRVDDTPLTGKVAHIDLGVEKTKTVTIHIEAPGCVPQEKRVTLKRGLNPPVVVILDGDAKHADDASANGGTSTDGSAAAATVTDVTGLLHGVADGGALASFRHDEVENTLTVRVQSITSAPYRVRASYRPQSLVEGQTYEIRFRARANASRLLTVSGEGLTGTTPHNIGLKTRIQIGTDFQDFTLRFRATNVSRTANFAPLFLFGDKKGMVQIGGLVLAPVDGPVNSAGEE